MQSGDGRDVLEVDAIETHELVQADPVEEPLLAEPVTVEAIDVDEPQPVPPARTRRVRKAPTAGRAAARKPSGARAPRRRKTPVPA
jgi:hypothetical protein